MKIVKTSIEDLVPDASNARSHSERNIKSIMDSLTRFGQQKPVVIDSNSVVVAGNGTVEAAKRLGWEKVSTVTTKLDGVEKTAFAIADNRTAELAVWDMGQLADHIEVIQDVDGMLESIGFTDGELETLFNTVESPEDFETINPETMDLENICPQCGFEF
jgi:ParB-like chromosome segregation protein Spo0J